MNTLPEEMINPTRDLPLSCVIAMSLSGALNVLANVAYFTVLSPKDVLASETVAITYMMVTLGKAASWVLIVAIVVSSLGAVNGSYLSDTKYHFAAGRYRQMPQIFAMIQNRWLTPLAAMIILCIMAVFDSF